jgi:hypothetical protein
MTMEDVVNWIEAHPVLFAVVLWPMITALVTWFTKPKTDDELALMSPRAAAFWRLVRKAGFDSKGVLDALHVLLRRKPPAPPGPPTLRLLSVLCLVCVTTTSACLPALSPEDATELVRYSDKLAQCREEGRDAGSYAAYEKCKKREGLE